MGRTSLILAAAASLSLAACGDAANAPTAPASMPPQPLPAGPVSYADAASNPAAIGHPAEFHVTVIAGDTLTLSGETLVSGSQVWNAPSGKEHALAPAVGFSVGSSCIYVVTGDDRTPVLPIQPVVVDRMQPCYAQSSFSMESVQLTGTVSSVRDVELTVDGAPATLKAVVLTDPNWKSPL
ncbi:MAG: hypothetical protein ABMA14_04260 [Hyphomonadaceae bacterium]